MQKNFSLSYGLRGIPQCMYLPVSSFVFCSYLLTMKGVDLAVAHDGIFLQQKLSVFLHGSGCFDYKGIFAMQQVQHTYLTTKCNGYFIIQMIIDITHRPIILMCNALAHQPIYCKSLTTSSQKIFNHSKDRSRSIKSTEISTFTMLNHRKTIGVSQRPSTRWILKPKILKSMEGGVFKNVLVFILAKLLWDGCTEIVVQYLTIMEDVTCN